MSYITCWLLIWILNFKIMAQGKQASFYALSFFFNIPLNELNLAFLLSWLSKAIKQIHNRHCIMRIMHAAHHFPFVFQVFADNSHIMMLHYKNKKWYQI